MPVFKSYLKIVNKNKGSLFINIMVFVALMIIFTSMTSDDFAFADADTEIEIAVIDRDGSTLSAALTAYLDDRHILNDLPDNSEKLQDALFYRDVEYILIIPEGFERDFLNGGAEMNNVKLPGSASGVYLDNQTGRFLSTTRAYLSAGYTLDGALFSTASDLQLSTSVEAYGGQAIVTPPSHYFFSYFAYIIIALMLAALGPALITFYKRGIRDRMNSSSLKLFDRNFQTALGSIVISLGVWLLFMIASLVIYNDEMMTLVGALRIANSFALLLVCVSIAFLLGQFVKNTNVLGAATNAVALGMSFTCGVFVPQQFLGETVLSVGKFLPAYWYVRTNDMLSTAKTPNMGMFYEGVLILLGFAVAIFAVSLVVSRRNRNAATE